MDYLLNTAKPLIMHIDLNSCFAIIEQQANALYRNKPLAVAAYDSPKGMVIASSYEAKAKGIKLGVNVAEAKEIDPDVIILMPDPPKYRYAHSLFREVLEPYNKDIHAKSIDEFVIDFRGSPAVSEGRDLVEVGHEIKERVKERLGGYVTVNVGIGTNRFWAKTAAGLHKPDGLDIMSAENAVDIYKDLELTDLTGINYRYEARLNGAGIESPIQFLEARADKLHKQVFHSIVGKQWFSRLRGWEVDDVVWGRKTIGHNYAIGRKTADRDELAKLLMKLCHKVGMRMRRQGYSARGIHLSVGFQNGYWWAKSQKTSSMLYSNQDIYHQALQLLKRIVIPAVATHISVSVYMLVPTEPEQLSVFGGTRLDTKTLADAADVINNKYGDYTIMAASMLGLEEIILDRIAFGSVKDYIDS